MATYAIGDIQGCFDELISLLEKINFSPLDDTLWFVGDLVNRGPKSLEVLRFVKSLAGEHVVILGNHDLHCLAVNAGKTQQNSDDTLDAILAASDCNELCIWLRQQKLIHTDNELGFTICHAGIPPQWSLDDAHGYAQEVESVLQSDQHIEFFENMYGNTPDSWSNELSGWDRLRTITNYLTRMRFCDANGKLNLSCKNKPGTHPENVYPWFEIPNEKTNAIKIIFGHWATLEGKTSQKNLFAIDTGCIWGGPLTALCLDDGVITQS